MEQEFSLLKSEFRASKKSSRCFLVKLCISFSLSYRPSLSKRMAFAVEWIRRHHLSFLCCWSWRCSPMLGAIVPLNVLNQEILKSYGSVWNHENLGVRIYFWENPTECMHCLLVLLLKHVVLIKDENRWRKFKDKPGKKEHHLWMKRDSAGSGQKALSLVRVISKISNEKEAVYGALDKWTAWETEFPLITAGKALGILRKRSQWRRLIQICKWMMSKGQGMTMGTYDVLLLAFDMEGRVEEAECIWNMILQKYDRSVSKRLFSRMISLYDHHRLPVKIIEVFADLEELGVRPDDDTVRRVERAFQNLGLDDKRKQLMEKYERKWKFLRFKGEQVRVKAMPTCY